MEKGVGKIYYFTSKIINWRIPSFSLLLKTECSRIWSPTFSYCLENGHFILMHRDWSIKPSKGSLALIFSSNDGKETPTTWVRFGMADKTTMEIKYCHIEWVETQDCGYFRVPNLINIEGLSSGVREVKPSFRFFCEVISQQSNVSTQTDMVSAINDIPNEDNEDSKKSKNEENSNEYKNLEKLSQNLKDLYVGSKESDLVIQVQDREFNVHRAILRARSSVFDAMFTHGLSESNNGIVPIEDCEAAVFEEFLFFIYSGKIHLSSDNACELFFIADKYHVPDLKEKCVHFLKKSLTTEIICDVICLSTKHNETELLEFAINFFANNMEEILVTVKWQVFLRENPDVSNELFIKALKLGFTKKNIV